MAIFATAAERRMIISKKQNKPIKTCADCMHESACRGWTGGRYISDDSASRCPNHETVKESGAYLCGVLDERKRKKTNADRIRSMTDEELAWELMLWRCEAVARHHGIQACILTHRKRFWNGSSRLRSKKVLKKSKKSVDK